MLLTNFGVNGNLLKDLKKRERDLQAREADLKKREEVKCSIDLYICNFIQIQNNFHCYGWEYFQSIMS